MYVPCVRFAWFWCPCLLIYVTLICLSGTHAISEENQTASTNAPSTVSPIILLDDVHPESPTPSVPPRSYSLHPKKDFTVLSLTSNTGSIPGLPRSVPVDSVSPPLPPSPSVPTSATSESQSSSSTVDSYNSISTEMPTTEPHPHTTTTTAPAPDLSPLWGFHPPAPRAAGPEQTPVPPPDRTANTTVERSRAPLQSHDGTTPVVDRIVDVDCGGLVHVG